MLNDENSQNPFDRAAEDAAKQTNDALKGEDVKVRSITWDQLKEMLPSQMDQQQLNELIKIVNSATDHNERVAALVQNISKLGGIIVKVLSKVPQA